MIVCSICAHSDWCDGGDTCDCVCHDPVDEFESVADDLDDDDVDYEED
ncbi:MAG TPA: hypothetical protein VMT81_02630 [Candidatus Paceibacterota bacterium]|nr:hypothetical protein [Candidatus Paceibacterota bacterium]